jgi:acyl-coenzyme A synthetase/AMP-(fatty) acid ligase
MGETLAFPAINPVAAIPRMYNFADDILRRNVDAGRVDKLAFIDPRGSWTYGDLAGRVLRFGHVLRNLGIAPEDRILLCLTDTIDWPTAFLGAIKAGVVAVPVNTLLHENDYRFMLDDSRAKLLVVSEELYGRFAPLIKACPQLKAVVVSGSDGHGHGRLEDLLESASGPDYTAPTTCDDMCFWLYTSGSTGQPKGAVHVHANPRLTADLYGVPLLGLTENDLVYSVAKLFFAYGLGNANGTPIRIMHSRTGAAHGSNRLFDSGTLPRSLPTSASRSSSFRATRTNTARCDRSKSPRTSAIVRWKP